LSVFLNCSCHLQMRLSSGGLTPYLHLNSHWTWIMDSNLVYHNIVCAFCCTADIVLIAQNM
jgi:hypothetical protein